jgi:transposase InsO family protein
MKYEFIGSERSCHPVAKMCLVLGVSRSGYYAHGRQGHGIRRKANERMLEEIKISYKVGRGAYGSPRITTDLRDRGYLCGVNRVARLMRINGIAAKTKRRFKATTNSRHSLPIAPNLLNKRFAAEGPDKVWVSDITYVWTDAGWLYLATILDLFSRRIVGWAMGDRITSELVIRALNQAIWKRKPAPGLILHSDRRSQYASDALRRALTMHDIIQSMSARGDCYDNAVAESFFHTLKTEYVYFERFRTRAEAQSGIFEYIEVFYNRIRRHSTLGNMSPQAFEQAKAA